MLPKTNYQNNRSVTEFQDSRHESLDFSATLHLILQLSLFPDLPPALRTLSIAELETELTARTLRMQYERERLEQEIVERRARLRQDILPFLTK